MVFFCFSTWVGGSSWPFGPCAGALLLVLFIISLLYFVVVAFRAPEPPFEVLEVSTTPISITSPSQPPPTTAEESNRDKPKEPSIMQVISLLLITSHNSNSIKLNINCL